MFSGYMCMHYFKVTLNHLKPQIRNCSFAQTSLNRSPFFQNLCRILGYHESTLHNIRNIHKKNHKIIFVHINSYQYETINFVQTNLQVSIQPRVEGEEYFPGTVYVIKVSFQKFSSFVSGELLRNLVHMTSFY